MNPGALLLIAAFLLVLAVASGPVMATYFWCRQRGADDARVLVVTPLVAVGLLGYLDFFAFFASPLLGRIFTFVVTIAPWFWIARELPRDRPRAGQFFVPALLGVGLGLFYLALLYLPELGRRYEFQSAFRFVHPLPPDPIFPQVLGDRLFAGQPVRPFIAEWLSSDRPPLQTGLYLLVLPWLHLARLPSSLGYQCLGTLAQLLWVPAAWLLARMLGLNHLRTVIVVLVIGTVGCFILNSVYVWPKLLAAGYVVFGGLLLLDPARERTAFVVGLAGVSIGLGWLAHGGVAYSLLALGPVWLLQRCAVWRRIPVAIAAWLILAVPWSLYQHVYDPPGNRLLKWHLAGVVPVDSRSFLDSLRAAYASLSWSAWLADKRANIAMIFSGSFRQLVDFYTTAAKARRIDEFFYLFRAIGVLNLAWFLWPAVWLIRRFHRPSLPAPAAIAGRNPALCWSLVAWTAFTLPIWIVLVFIPGLTVIHAGSYAVMLVACGLAAVFLLELPGWLSVFILGWHALYFAGTWLPYFGSAPLNAGMFVVFALAFALLAAGTLVARNLDDGRPPLITTKAARFLLRHVSGAFRHRAFVMVATTFLALLILFGRRPDTFLRPQFWAEDGAIFFNQADQFGWRALFIAYGGYYDFLLRVVAGLAAPLDPLWIPAVYFWANTAAVGAIALALFSPRLDLSCRPWLALAIVLVPHTGEVFNNLTNAQWIIALGLVLLLLARDPVRRWQWITDALLALTIGLTGIYSLLFSPLFIARALRRRTRYAWFITFVVVLAAAVQAVAWIHRPKSAIAGGAADPLAAALVAGRRIGASPWLTPWLDAHVPAAWIAITGLAGLGALAWAGLRSPARREPRMLLWGCVALFYLSVIWKFAGGRMLATGMLGDRYFFIPNVLLLWLLILEWNSTTRWKWFARGVCVLALIATVFRFRFEPYHDYNWPAWAAKIRAHQPVDVPINPPGFGFHYPGHWPP